MADEENQQEGSNTGLIVGIVLGVILAAVFIGIVVFLCCRRCKRKRQGQLDFQKNKPIEEEEGLLPSNSFPSPPMSPEKESKSVVPNGSTPAQNLKGTSARSPIEEEFSDDAQPILKSVSSPGSDEMEMSNFVKTLDALPMIDEEVKTNTAEGTAQSEHASQNSPQSQTSSGGRHYKKASESRGKDDVVRRPHSNISAEERQAFSESTVLEAFDLYNQDNRESYSSSNLEDSMPCHSQIQAEIHGEYGSSTSKPSVSTGHNQADSVC